MQQKREAAGHKQRKRLDLPFVRRRRDAGTVVYDHRAGIFAVVVLALALAVVFVASKINIATPEPVTGILLDLRTLEELQREQARLEREVRLRQQNTPVHNAVFNEGALPDDRASDTEAMRDAAESAQDRMQANRDAWNQGMRGIEAIGSGGESESSSAGVSGTERAKGRVLVSFSLLSPVRYSVHLEVPGYRCEGGGEVVITVVVARSGAVVSAVVDRGRSTSDDCMHSTALNAARNSRFNIDEGAPDRQSGTITYTFIPQ